MKTLTIELPDELYAVFEQTALGEGRTVRDVAIEWLAQNGSKPRRPLTEEERQAGLDDLRRFAGAVRSGDPHSADNDRIDADLAREYADDHSEEEP